jgi:hypothetical protein
VALRVDVLSAIVFDHGSWDQETGTIDPTIVLRGELPATADPFGVDRVYRGPQGSYDESFAIVDPQGRTVYQHDYGRISLRGQMFEDRFRDVVEAGPVFTTAEEHTLVLIINDRVAGRVPCFVDAPESIQAAGVMDDALASTLKKSAILWVTIPQPGGGEVTRPAWFVHDGGKVYLLTGPDEQDLTNIDRADEVSIAVRSKDVRSRIGDIPSSVRVIDNGSEEFDRITSVGVGTRLNLEDFDDAQERWKRTCTLVELTPQV